MNRTPGASERPPSLLAESLRAHLLQFGPVPAAAGAPERRVLTAFVGVAVVLFLLLRAALELASWRGQPAANLGFVATLLCLFVLVQRVWVGRPLAELGLRPWASWRRRERLYAWQVLPLATLAFALAFHGHLLALLARHGAVGFLLLSLLTGLLWGAVQEGLYRGWLQTGLTRQLGAWGGVLAANLIFTFGPLHWDHLLAAGGPRWGVLVAVFGIGLFFGLLYQRSGNLWLPALLHGLWPPNMT